MATFTHLMPQCLSFQMKSLQTENAPKSRLKIIIYKLIYLKIFDNTHYINGYPQNNNGNVSLHTTFNYSIFLTDSICKKCLTKNFVSEW